MDIILQISCFYRVFRHNFSALRLGRGEAASSGRLAAKGCEDGINRQDCDSSSSASNDRLCTQTELSGWQRCIYISCVERSQTEARKLQRHTDQSSHWMESQTF